MGQKVHPNGFRLGITTDWNSKWYADSSNYADLLNNDLQVRNYLLDKLKHASVSKIEIARPARNARITIHSARPGIVIGKKGAEIETLKQDLDKLSGRDCTIDIQEVRRPEADAQLVAESIAQQLERRVAFRRAMKKSVNTALKFGAKGIKIACSGRLGGAEIARREWYREGRVPLHTLRADIDYGLAEAKTTFGIIGVKVWIFKGEVLADRVELE